VHVEPQREQPWALWRAAPRAALDVVRKVREGATTSPTAYLNPTDASVRQSM